MKKTKVQSQAFRTLLQNPMATRQLLLMGVLILEIAIFALFLPNFRATTNFVNVIRQVSITTITSTGMFMIILLGDIDLSVGAMYAIIGVLCASFLIETGMVFPTILLGLLLGTGIGWIKGVIVAKGKVPSFVTTLAFMNICRGAARVITGGAPLGIYNEDYNVIGAGYIFKVIPIPVALMVLVLAVGYYIIRCTRLGRYIYAVGGNEAASRWSGLRTDRVKIAVFTIAGLLTGLAAVVLSGRLGGGLPEAGDGAEMDAITAVILGGTSLSGGRGSLAGVVLGVLVLGFLSNGLTMLQVSSYWQDIIKGLIILFAVLIDSWHVKD